MHRRLSIAGRPHSALSRAQVGTLSMLVALLFLLSTAAQAAPGRGAVKTTKPTTTAH
ncbi:MAG: hypothetical protein GY811_10845 [Myxococcales bacterium]|nr:hypothetical protein [Myxococcales bacterium]